MTKALKQPTRSWGLLRTLVRGVAWLFSGAAIGSMVLFIFVLSLPTRNLLLLPVALALLPIALAVVILGIPCWGIGAACGLWLLDKEGVHGTIECEGIRLDAVHRTGPEFVAWTALDEVVRVLYPLSIHYRLKLKDGSDAQVDFLDEEQLLLPLQEHGVGFRRLSWFEQKAH